MQQGHNAALLQQHQAAVAAATGLPLFEQLAAQPSTIQGLNPQQGIMVFVLKDKSHLCKWK
jgi:hypothetical protein